MSHRAITLYSFVDFDRGSRVRWLAHELNLQVTEKRLNFTAAEQRGEPFRKIHPFGQIPAVEFRGQKLWESAAICQYLVEEFPDAGLAPLPNSPDRGPYLSWLFFGATTFDKAAFDVFYNSVMRPSAGDREVAIEQIKPLLEVLNERLKRYDHVLGDRFRLPDLLLGHGLALLLMSKAIAEGSYTAVVRYLERLAARPAAIKSKLFAAAAKR
jgi:glutathione S-transferase